MQIVYINTPAKQEKESTNQIINCLQLLTFGKQKHKIENKGKNFLKSGRK
jgi:hypothetical protein